MRKQVKCDVVKSLKLVTSKCWKKSLKMLLVGQTLKYEIGPWAHLKLEDPTSIGTNGILKLLNIFLCKVRTCPALSRKWCYYPYISAKEEIFTLFRYKEFLNKPAK